MKTTIHFPSRGIRFHADSHETALEILSTTKYVGPVIPQDEAGLYLAWLGHPEVYIVNTDQDPGDEA